MSQEAEDMLVETWPKGRSQGGVKKNPELGRGRKGRERRKRIPGRWNSMSKARC